MNDSGWTSASRHALGALLAFALSASAADKSPGERWEKDIRAFEAADKTTPPTQGAVLFIGSSSIRLWKTLAQDFPEYRVINRGFGGSEVADSVYFADRIVIPYRPRLIVMYAGTNDINDGKTPERVFADFQAFVAKVRATLPGVRIAYMAINPCPARWAQADQQRQANQLIQDYVAAGTNLDFIDIFDAYLGPDGKPRADLFVADGLHNNAAGYKIRAALTRPHLGAPAKDTSAEGKADPSALYLDPSQPLDRRVADLISRMTLEEKALELYHKAPAIERLRIPFWAGWNQCLHGVWSKQPTTEFPVSIAMAATWDPALVHAEADAISDEARALYNVGASGPSTRHGLVYRAPVVNISRDPRWGRIQECYGEDPFLTSRIGVAYVQGLQGSDPRYLKVAATLKHFAVNNQENGRLSLSAQVPERMLHEYWLPHFKACVVEGGACSLMAAYNAINGAPCAVNPLLLTDILRGRWGFDGFVVSDLGGIGHLMSDHHFTTQPEEAVAAALQAGCDYDDEQFRDAIPGAVRNGLLPEKVVDRALTRVLRTAFRLGVFDPPERVPFSKIPTSVIHSPAHRELALKAEREAIVLLSNRHHFLPLDRNKLQTIAVIGPAAERPEYGNYFGAAPRRVSPLEGLKNKLGTGVEIRFAAGCGMTEPANLVEMEKAVEAARRAEVVILFLGTNGRVENEGRDRTDLGLPGAQEQLLEAVCRANPRTVVVLLNAGPLSVPWAKDHTAAIIEAWYPGEEGGTAIADVLFGDCNPGGRLPYTVYASTAQIPPQTEYDVTKGFTYLYFTGRPVFPFGHGLSYTEFRYRDLTVSPRRIPADGQVSVRVQVENVGRRAGDEVVQLYVHARKASVKRPIKELRGFERVRLQPGEQRTVTFTLNGNQLAFYDVQRHDFTVEPGAFDVLVGSSSADIRARRLIEVK